MATWTVPKVCAARLSKESFQDVGRNQLAAGSWTVIVVPPPGGHCTLMVP